MLDFEAIKRIKLVEVASVQYQIPLRYRGDYANAPCPLRTHKEGDKGKNFSINIPGNYWRCFSDTCNANNGGKRGGDVINFVAAMEGCREKEAAEKLAAWYGIGKENAAPRRETRLDTVSTTTLQKDYPEPSTASGSVKYMASIDAWYDGLVVRGKLESDEDYRKRVLNGIKAKLVESYRNGKAAVS